MPKEQDMRNILFSNDNGCLQLNYVQPLHNSLSILVKKFKIMNLVEIITKNTPEFHSLNELQAQSGSSL